MNEKSVCTATPKDGVDIIGGGITGLSVAIALAQYGIKATLYEREKILQNTGAGLQLSPNALRALESLSVHIKGTPIDGVRLLRASDERALAFLPFAHNPRYRVVHRSTLINCLAARAEELGVEVKLGIAKTAERGRITLAADGLHSTHRKMLFDAPARASNTVAWRSQIPLSRLSADWRAPIVRSYLDPHAHLVTYPLEEVGALNLVLITSAARGVPKDEADAARIPEQSLENFSPNLATLLREADEAKIWELFDVPTLSTWSKDQTILLGDAAHAMLPHFAQGAAMGLEDAVIFARMFSEDPSAASFARFEAFRKKRVARVQKIAISNHHIFQMQNPVLRGARDLVLPLASRIFPKALSYRVKSTYDYDPRIMR